MGAGDRAHVEDDPHHREPRRDHGGWEADLSLAVQEAAARCREQEEEGAEQLGEQPSPLQARVVELRLVAELERDQMPGPRAEQPIAGALSGRDRDMRLGRAVGHGRNLLPARASRRVGERVLTRC